MESSSSGPSEIAREYYASIDEQTLSHEDVLERLLSALSELPDYSSECLRATAYSAEQKDADNGRSSSLPRKIWNVLSGQETTLLSLSLESTSEQSRAELQREWEQGLVLASRIVERVSPTELHSTTASCVVFGDTTDEGRIMYTTTCILLCCMALQNCPFPVDKRWKRWQSLQLETIRLYQQYGQSDIDLWCDHVLPATWHLQQALLAGTIPSSPGLHPRWMGFEAGSVQCSAHLAEQAAGNHGLLSTKSPSMFDATCQKLFTALDQNVLRGRYEILYEHPWRKHMQQHNEESKTESNALSLYTLPILENQEDEEERREQVMGMKTVWSDAGVSILAAGAGWKVRPLVWDSHYQWRLFFPHVDILLLGTDSCDIKDDFGGIPTENESGYIVEVKVLGYDLLQGLLQLLPDRSLRPLVHKNGAPDSPIGTCQLIANQIVSSSTLEKSTPPQTCSARALLPTAAQAFLLLKGLVSKYIPGYQVEIVRTLMQECPHPGLLPKLVDTLRDFVRWKNENAERHVWRFLETSFLSDLDRYTGGKNGILTNVDELIGSVEVYGAALGLVQLWLMCNREVPTALPDLDGTLKRMHNATEKTLEHWSSTCSGDGRKVLKPVEYHRLNLLESLLARTVDILKSIQTES